MGETSFTEENSFEEEKEGHLEKEDGNNLPTDSGKEPHL